MTRKTAHLPLLLGIVAAGAVAFTLAACGGSKRPPVLTSAPPERGPSPGPSRTPTQPVETGPDLRPLPNDAARAEDFPTSDRLGEGGPLEDIHFEFDRAALTDAARATLEKHALWLQNRRQARVTIEGHCDERGTVEYNLALGDQRARAARDYLVSLGVAPDRLRAVSFGKERPLDPASNEAAWAKNRRVHFVVAP